MNKLLLLVSKYEALFKVTYLSHKNLLQYGSFTSFFCTPLHELIVIIDLKVLNLYTIQFYFVLSSSGGLSNAVSQNGHFFCKK